jgi:hypothetical protein
MHTSAAGWMAIGFFVVAWVLNQRLEGQRWSPYVVMPVATAGSIMMYAATWSTSWANGLTGFMHNFSAGMPTEVIFSMICVATFAAVIADMWFDPTYNLTAIFMLVLLPVASHGAGGIVGSFMEALYTAFSLGTLDAIKELFGG